MSQVMGVDEDLAISVVFFEEQVDQFAGGAAIKVPPGLDMQVAVLFIALDLKIGAHNNAS